MTFDQKIRYGSMALAGAAVVAAGRIRDPFVATRGNSRRRGRGVNEDLAPLLFCSDAQKWRTSARSDDDTGSYHPSLFD